MRNSEGDIIGVKGKGLPKSTNLVIEDAAIKKGIQYCIDRNLIPLIVKIYSLTIAKYPGGKLGDTLECCYGG
ncbi:hypothetical protein RDI58_010709 [Solanum bulbocastanum]|uniref:Uncharacterized protein n=1 Tax=Solanum bulbocastanum TaxID=147425 RepID=A0AAN8TNF2_SOLBU